MVAASIFYYKRLLKIEIYFNFQSQQKKCCWIRKITNLLKSTCNFYQPTCADSLKVNTKFIITLSYFLTLLKKTKIATFLQAHTQWERNFATYLRGTEVIEAFNTPMEDHTPSRA